MLSLFIMLFIALGIAIGIGFGIVTLIDTAQTSLTIQANQVRMQNIASSIRAGLSIDNGGVLLPARAEEGEPKKLYARLPDLSPFSTNTSGANIVYCPALEKATNDMQLVNKLDNNDDGAVENIWVSTTEIAGQTYISKGHAAELTDSDTLTRMKELGIVAYLLSPQPNTVDPLRCGDVDIGSDNYSLVINGGTATAIYAATSDASGSIFVLSADGSKPSGYNKSFRVVKTLNDVTEFIDRYKLSDVTVRLPDTITFTLTDIERFIASGSLRTIRLEPENSSTVLSIDAENSAVPSRNAYLKAVGQMIVSDIEFKGINGLIGSFDVGISSKPAANVVIDGGIVAGLKSEGGRINVINGTLINPEHGSDTVVIPVNNQGGQIRIDSSIDQFTTIDAQSAVTMFRASAGDTYISENVEVKAGASTLLNRALNKGRVIILADSEPGKISVTRTGSTEMDEALIPTTEIETIIEECDETSDVCLATCTPNKIVVSGGCSNASGMAITGSTPLNGNTYECRFTAPPLTSKPTATAICDYPQN